MHLDIIKKEEKKKNLEHKSYPTLLYVHVWKIIRFRFLVTLEKLT